MLAHGDAGLAAADDQHVCFLDRHVRVPFPVAYFVIALR
jgi:hypothetical protein